MRTSTPNRRPTGMDQLRIIVGYFYSTWPAILFAATEGARHAGDRGEIPEPSAAFAAWHGDSSDLGPAARDAVQRADGGESGGARGQCVARSFRRDGSGGNRSVEPRRQGSLLRGKRGSGGGGDPGESGEPGYSRRFQAAAGRIAARLLAHGAATCGGRCGVHRSAVPPTGCLHEYA